MFKYEVLDYESRKLDREEKLEGSYQQILTGQKLSSNSQTNSHRLDKVPTSCSVIDFFKPPLVFIYYIILYIYLP